MAFQNRSDLKFAMHQMYFDSSVIKDKSKNAWLLEAHNRALENDAFISAWARLEHECSEFRRIMSTKIYEEKKDTWNAALSDARYKISVAWCQ